MWLIALGALANAAYCTLYLMHCARNKNALAAIGSALLALIPVAILALCVISRVG